MGSSGVAYPELYVGQKPMGRPRRQAFPVKLDSLGLGPQLGRGLRLLFRVFSVFWWGFFVCFLLKI